MANYYWNVERINQGQIVTIYDAQLHNAAEGSQGAARGLRLTVDASDGEWVVYCGSTELDRGCKYGSDPRKPPSVQEAMSLAHA